MSTRLHWRLLLGEFVVIVVGVLMALWVDQLREARANAELEVEYLESLVVDLEADLAQFDSTEAWMRRQEAAAATVLALYEGPPPTENVADLVAAVETTGWQFFPSITRFPAAAAALRAFPELEVAAGEVLYQTIGNRGSMKLMRSAALELRATLEQRLAE